MHTRNVPYEAVLIDLERKKEVVLRGSNNYVHLDSIGPISRGEDAILFNCVEVDSPASRKGGCDKGQKMKKLT